MPPGSQQVTDAARSTRAQAHPFPVSSSSSTTQRRRGAPELSIPHHLNLPHALRVGILFISPPTLLSASLPLVVGFSAVASTFPPAGDPLLPRSSGVVMRR
ncbi:hypothetical protein ACRE_029700 [Hapsidospora chrysogenum ATCC 11550]|uniref:Uncharacterized protein n=1 Tax=Hapsidospora chrysogenum (strain ATCC 11550 / CBS 779.69 / DSM 880 / IAM 14645 / JCM 23072 / IMI 49137) TaxID=857340 RepID=A0A086TA08_HAPC1|nr:hypothetical protein ACRE_029700 [Hapsidospora chrysogenum ATCC 11550]